MSDILVDTDIVIELLNRRQGEVSDRWDTVAGNASAKVHYSPVTAAELWHGMRPREEAETAELLASFTCLPVTKDVGLLGGQYLKRFHASHGIGLGDALIAATASVYGCALWTRNRKHYPMRDITLF